MSQLTTHPLVASSFAAQRSTERLAAADAYRRARMATTAPASGRRSEPARRPVRRRWRLLLPRPVPAG